MKVVFLEDVMASLKLKGTLSPVIFLTGHGAEEVVVQVIQAGADDYRGTPSRLPVALLPASDVTPFALACLSRSLANAAYATCAAGRSVMARADR